MTPLMILREVPKSGIPTPKIKTALGSPSNRQSVSATGFNTADAQKRILDNATRNALMVLEDERARTLKNKIEQAVVNKNAALNVDNNESAIALQEYEYVKQGSFDQNMRSPSGSNDLTNSVMRDRF